MVNTECQLILAFTIGENGRTDRICTYYLHTRLRVISDPHRA